MRSAICAPALLAVAGALYGQQIISAKSGLLNHIEGNALLNGYQIMVRPGEFPQMNEGDALRTEKGHQEVLLGPGVFLRLGENSAFRLVSALLTDTRVDFEKGSAVVEAMLVPGAAIYAHACGWTLARAHARSGDPVAIAAYLGKSDRFDRSITDFALRYADQNEQDFQAFTKAIESGSMTALQGV